MLFIGELHPRLRNFVYSIVLLIAFGSPYHRRLKGSASRQLVLSSRSNAGTVAAALSDQLPLRMFDVQLTFTGGNIWVGQYR